MNRIVFFTSFFLHILWRIFCITKTSISIHLIIEELSISSYSKYIKTKKSNFYPISIPVLKTLINNAMGYNIHLITVETRYIRHQLSYLPCLVYCRLREPHLRVIQAI